MKVELKHLIPYLPYSLKVIMEGKKTIVAWMSTKNIAVIRPDGIGEYKKIPWERAHLNIQPILRPLSDILKEYPLNGDYEGWQQEWINHIWDFEIKTNEANILACPYDLMQDLLSKHFDVFGLIEKGLAIDINTLDK